jgi:hypothetical protein
LRDPSYEVSTEPRRRPAESQIFSERMVLMNTNERPRAQS